MKVNVLTPYSLNRNVGIREKEEKQQLSQNPINSRNYMGLDKFPIGFVPHQISFGCQDYAALKEIIELKKLVDLPCIYCGKKMLKQHTYESIGILQPKQKSVKAFFKDLETISSKLSPEEKIIISELRQLNERQPGLGLAEALKQLEYKPMPNIETILYKKASPEQYSKHYIDTIKKYKETLPPVNNEVFEEVLEYYKTHPKATLQEIFGSLRKKHIEILTQQQLEVFNKIKGFSTKLPEEHKQKITLAIENAINIINKNDINNPFKKKTFITDVNKIAEDFKNTEQAKELMELATSLPSSTSKASAFIVKYSGETPLVIKPQQDIKPLEERILNKEEQAILAKLKGKYKDIYPEKSVNKILPLIYQEHVRITKEAQLKAISAVQSKTAETVESLQKDVQKINENLKSTIQDPLLDSYESRKLVLKYLKGLNNILNDESLSDILKIADNMPYSQNDINAFIIKYKDRFNTKSTNPVTYELDNALPTKEKKIFERIKANYSKGPQSTFDRIKQLFRNVLQIPPKTLQQKIDRTYEKTLESFVESQNEVLDSINNYLQRSIKNLKKDITNIVTGSQNNNYSEQKSTISRIRLIKTPFNESIYESVIEPLSNLPTSKNDISAFVVKYAQKEFSPAVITKVKRSDTEICQALLRDSTVSVEHIEPQSEIKNGSTSSKDINHIKNLALAHKHCNQQRGSQHLYGYVQEHPEIKIQAQKQMDYIIESLNKGTITCYDYPVQIKQTLYEQSCGLIDLDISKLKTKELAV